MVATKRLLSRARGSDAKRRRLAPGVTRAIRSLQESKYCNTAISHVTSANSTTVLSNIAAGTGSSERDGRKILATHMQVRALNTTSSYPLRVVLYVPKNPSSTLTLTNMYDGIENDEYWVLYDRIQEPSMDHTSTQGLIININLSKKVTVEYSDSTGTAVRNPIKCLIQSDVASQTVRGHVKLWYKDI